MWSGGWYLLGPQYCTIQAWKHFVGTRTLHRSTRISYFDLICISFKLRFPFDQHEDKQAGDSLWDGTEICRVVIIKQWGWFYLPPRKLSYIYLKFGEISQCVSGFLVILDDCGVISISSYLPPSSLMWLSSAILKPDFTLESPQELKKNSQHQSHFPPPANYFQISGGGPSTDIF